MAVIAGCSHDKPEKSDVGSAPIAQPGISAASAGADPAVVPLPGQSAGAVAVVPGNTAAPATTRARVTATPSHPANLPTRNAAALQNAWITATVTRGGNGPCYTLTTSAGVTYSAYSTQGIQLADGAHVRARITPGTTPLNCGSGRPARLERVQLAG
ncbi:hypothetical protein [Actinoplanes sp. NPDC026619]|uniref:hypothetical protein n=1 Tax=Actinoplanes sp. NPDC026619 TaxID=3155798 RepID=UPI0033DC105A